MDDVDRIVAGLTKASKRALFKMRPGEWIEEGSPGPARTDAYSLWWGRDGKHGLVESPAPFAFSICGCRWKWKPTKLGAAVRARLAEVQSHD